MFFSYTNNLSMAFWLQSFFVHILLSLIYKGSFFNFRSCCKIAGREVGGYNARQTTTHSLHKLSPCERLTPLLVNLATTYSPTKGELHSVHVHDEGGQWCKSVTKEYFLKRVDWVVRDIGRFIIIELSDPSFSEIAESALYTIVKENLQHQKKDDHRVLGTNMLNS